MEKNEAAAFYQSVSEAVEGHFSEKYRLDPGQLSGDFLLEKMTAAGEGATGVERFERVWRACEMARFAGLPDVGAMAGILADAEALIERH